jgi:3-oxoacyl-[acyl-carrier protein] reductase
MRLLEGRVALVTGAAQGIGLAMAKTFAEQGAAIVIADMNGDAAEKAKASVKSLGAKALVVEADVREPEQVQAMVDAASSQLGSLDVLVNNAGITRDATMRKMKLEDWQAVIDVHLAGTFLATQAASLVMREQRRGSIVNISSIAGKVGMIGQTNYSAAKAGIIGLTKAAAKELAHHGVRVNAIQPGLIRTAMTAALREDIWEQKMSEIPMGRAGEPEEVANVALFLASDLSSYMTGTVLEVTGGRYM